MEVSQESSLVRVRLALTFPGGVKYLQSGTKVVDTLVENGCFCQTFSSFIISFRLNAANPLTLRINVA